ncbi:MAG: AMP-binding protein, partial [Clostridia bacterium]|nr:AMP-binding protein [Clostridia bacterium]
MENGLHLTVADSGWAKFSWGKIYGQWIAGSAVMGYDMDKFHASNLMRVIHDYGVTTFCAPATMYRFMIKEDMSEFDLSSVKHFSMAGEPLNPSVMEAWQKITGHRIYEGFGQTESVVIMANYGWADPRPG